MQRFNVFLNKQHKERIMRTFIFLLLTAAHFLCAQGRIIIPPLPEPQPQPLPAIPVELSKVLAHVSIKQDIAHVQLQQHVTNKSHMTLEGDYLYSLPEISQIDDFYLYIDGKKTKGELLDSKQARAVYDNIVRSMRDPALLEYTGYGLFKAHIFPIPAGQSRQIELSYDQVVSFESGHYRFALPIRQSGQGAIKDYEIKIDLQSNQSLANIYSPSHKIEVDRNNDREITIRFDGKNVDGSKDFILFYSLSSEDINGSLLSFRPRTDRDGYFMFFASPAFGLKDKKAIAKDVIFVIDVSGSMGGEKIEQARDALRFCVNVLNKDDRFEIIAFSSSLRMFSGKLQHASREARTNALYFVDNLNANGGTNINAALLKALNLKSIRNDRPTSIVFLTDGLPTEGVTDIKTIVNNVQNEAKGFIRLFNFGVGYDVNTWLIDRLARESNGSARYVKPGENIESAISGLFTKISSPLLTDTRLTVADVEIYDVYPQKLPDIFKGQRIMITGRYRKTGSSDVTLSGREDGRPKEFAYEVNFARRNSDNDFIAKLWANRKINYLLNKIRFEGESDELVASVKMLAEEFGIVTPYTSYLVREQQEELAQAEMRRDAPQMAARMKSRQSALESQGMGTGVLNVLGEAMAVDASAASGRSAVMKSSTQQKKMEAEQADDMLLIHKNTAGKAFTLDNGIWIENGVDVKSANKVELKFMDKEYLTLLNKNSDIKKILALGTEVVFEWDGTVYKVVK
jgi:Ca-activated chloride channel family protein